MVMVAVVVAVGGGGGGGGWRWMEVVTVGGGVCMVQMKSSKSRKSPADAVLVHLAYGVFHHPDQVVADRLEAVHRA